MWTHGFPSWGEAQGVEVRGQGGCRQSHPTEEADRRSTVAPAPGGLPRAGFRRPASTPQGSEAESGGWMCISLVTDGGQRRLTDISEETAIQVLCSCFSEAAFLADFREFFISCMF